MCRASANAPLGCPSISSCRRFRGCVVFFMTLFPTLLLPQQRARMLGSFVVWGPGAISIAVALSVAALIRSARMPLSVKANIGLAFEVAASYGIAAAEFLDPLSLAVKGSWTG